MNSFLTHLCFVLSLFALLVSDGAAVEKSDTALNLTEPFKALYKQKISAQPSFDQSAFVSQIQQDYNIVMVGGILSGMGKLGLQRNFGKQAQFLHKLGLQEGHDYQIAGINSFQTINYNIEKLRNIIQKSPKGVLLVCHSKGGLDSFATLVKYPELQSKVKGIITIQTPFYGSPVADEGDRPHSPAGSFVHELMTRLLPTRLKLEGHRGSYEALLNLRSFDRQNYLHAHQQELAHIVRSIPTIHVVGSTTPIDSDLEIRNNNPQQGGRMLDGSLAVNRRSFHDRLKIHQGADPMSCFPRTTGGWGAPFSKFVAIAKDILQRHGVEKSDNLVPASSQRLPGGQYVNLHGVDHLSLVMASSHNKIEKVRATVSLIEILLKKAKN